MKRLLMMLAAAVAVTAPIVAAGEAVARDDDGRRAGWRRDAERGDDRRASRDRAPRELRGDYGPPPQMIYRERYEGRGGPGWRRGGFLPPNFQGRMVHDYPRHRLRPPPRGYAWYRVGDDYLMASQLNGLIFDVID